MKNSERILLQFKDDERKGFRLLYDSFYDSLVLFATQFIGEAEEAADIVQECFVDFWVNRRFSLLLEKPRDFDPFGHAGLSPLATI